MSPDNTLPNCLPHQNRVSRAITLIQDNNERVAVTRGWRGQKINSALGRGLLCSPNCFEESQLQVAGALCYALDIFSGVDLLDEDRETRNGAHSSQFTSGGGGNCVFGILSIVMHLLINPNQMGSSLL